MAVVLISDTNPGTASFTDVNKAMGDSGYRPDRDLAWEATILAGDGDVHVDSTTGSDTTGDGTPSAPFATLQRAVLSIPQNRSEPSLRTVTINLTAGDTQQLPVLLEGWNSLSILAPLPTAAASGSITSVTSTTTATTIDIDTDIAYTADNAFTGFLIVYQSGKYGQVIQSNNDGGGFTRLRASQAVNGTAYDTLVNTNTFDLYDPDAMCELQSVNTGGNGTNFNDCDGLLIRRCKLTSVGGNGKLVHYSSRITYRDCHIGPQIRRVFMSNGSIQITNCFISVPGEGRFGMVGGAAYSVVQIRGGTCFWGTNAPDADSYPLSVSNSRLILSGPAIMRDVRAASLTDSSTIDYADGYNAEVSWYWYEQRLNEPFVVVDEHTSGAPVRGTVPDIHGDTNLSIAYLVRANSPCQLWVGQGTDVSIENGANLSTFPVSVRNGGGVLSGDAYDGSFIRSNRLRSTSVYGPVVTSPTGLAGTTTALLIDWFDGTEQTYDLSDASNNTTAIIDWYFDNPAAGTTHTLKLIEAITVTHDWTNIPVRWAGGTPPTLSAGSGDIDILQFYFDGTNWYGSAVALDAS